ncbi:MAG: hypothetical protein AAF587_16020 [Bacteroidota bacterium]
MKQPSRRNRNIGTAKQGHGQSNRMVIPEDYYKDRSYKQKFGKHVKVQQKIRDKTYTIVVEETRNTCIHACTVEDILLLLTFLPEKDLEGLNLIFLRQPKRKEELMSPVWGRYGWFPIYGDGITLEALDYTKKLYMPKQQTVERKKEFLRLQKDGHRYEEQKRYFVAEPRPANVRHGQLFRTFLHEIGHHVDWMNQVERPIELLVDWEEREKQGMDEDLAWHSYAQESDAIYAAYKQKSMKAKEDFAHRYAEELAQKLKQQDLIPFPRRLSATFMNQWNLRIEDFELSS